MWVCVCVLQEGNINTSCIQLIIHWLLEQPITRSTIELSQHSAFVANINFITVKPSVSHYESRHCASIPKMIPAVYTNAVTFHITA